MNQEIASAFFSMFHSDQVPYSWDEWPADLHLQRARSVASRIRARLDDGDVVAAHEWLASGKDDRQGSVVRALSHVTNFDWAARDDDWHVMREVLDEVVAVLGAEKG